MTYLGVGAGGWATSGCRIDITLSKNYAFKGAPHSADRNFDVNSKVVIDYTNVTLEEKEKKSSRDKDL